MPTVLLVDDSATDRRVIGGILEKNGPVTRSFCIRLKAI